MLKKFTKCLVLLMSLAMIFTTTAGCFGGGGGGGQGGGGGVTPPNPGTVVDDNIRNSTQFLATVDNVGREIEVGQLSDEQYHVGIFYHLWHGDFGMEPTADGPDALMSIQCIQSLLDSGNYAQLYTTADVNKFYYWGEPLYGFYSSTDEWVLTRHVELFTMAGIDYLCIDATNPLSHNTVTGEYSPRLFKKPVEVLLKVLKKMQDQGFQVPRVTFYTNTGSSDTVWALYNEYYTNSKYAEYSEIWFKPNGKPLIIGITEQNASGTDQIGTRPSDWNYKRTITDWELLDYFDIKDSKWPSTGNNEARQTNAMPWMSWSCPQPIFSATQYDRDWNNDERDGYIAVPVAQHGHSFALTSVSARGAMTSRAYDNTTHQRRGDWKEGLSYQQMWDTVHTYKTMIKTVMVTGWNEWIAQKQAPAGEYVGKPDGNNTTGVHFVDVFDAEHSRDIEMMRGGYGDNFYLQTVYNIRKLKREPVSGYDFPSFTLDMNHPDLAVQWEDMGTTYRDFEGDAIERAHYNATGYTGYYSDTSNRNDIVNIKITHDDVYYYIYVDTLENITAYNGTDTNWMNIHIGTSYGANTFAGFNYVINRSPNGNTTSIHQYNNGTWSLVGSADLKVQENMMMVRIPMATIGRSFIEPKIRFKVSDNVQNQNDIMDYYVTGDSAPIGRLGFVYGS